MPANANTAPTFTVPNGTGKRIIPVGTSDDYGRSVIVQADGKIVVAGWEGNSPGQKFAVVRFNTDGSLDTTFGTGGKVTQQVGSPLGNDQAIQVLEVGGKLLVVGTSSNGVNTDFSAMRLNTNGTLDLSFNTTGTMVRSVGAGVDLATGALVQPTGEIVIVGRAAAGNFDFAVMRLTPAGALDLTFNSTGIRTIASPLSELAEGIARDGAGNLVLAGHQIVGTVQILKVTRLNSTGGVDGSFGTLGETLVPNFSAGSQDFAESVLIDSSGKILVAGWTQNVGVADFALVRLTTTGALDSTFGVGGKVSIDINGASFDIAYEVKELADGRIVIVGTSNADITVVRLLADGSLDTSLGSTGKLLFARPLADNGYSIAIQPDGKMVLAGVGWGGSDNDFQVIRLNENGSLDLSFGSTAPNTLASSIAYVSGAVPIALDTAVGIYDLELKALNGGLGDYGGATLTVNRSGSADPNDMFSGTGGLLFNSGVAELSGVPVGTVNTTGGTLFITFAAGTTQVQVDEVLSSIAYSNSASPPGAITLDWVFNDGNTGAQGTGLGESPIEVTTVNITAIADVTAPVFGSATVNGNLLVLTYTDANNLDTVATPAVGDFVVTRNGVSNAVVNVAVVNATFKTVTLTLTNAVVAGDVVTLSYFDDPLVDAAFAIQDVAGNDAVALTGIPVANLTPDVAPPVFSSAVVNGNQLVMTYTDANILGAPPGPGSFAVGASGVAVLVTGVAVNASAKTITLTLASAVTSAQVVSVAYTDPSGGDDAAAIQDINGFDAASLPTTVVANITPVPLPPNTPASGLGNVAPSNASGTPPQQDDVLSINTQTLVDPDGLGPLGYQWQKDGVNIVGAGASTYLVKPGDVASRISVEVSYFDGQGNFERTSSARTVQITDNDGIANALEAITPSQPGQTLFGDGNRDGVLDTLQVQVTASQVAGLTGYASSFITFVADSNKGAIDADPGTAVLRNFKIDVLSPTVKPNPSMSFKADVGTPGATETFSVFADVAFAFSGFWLQTKSGDWVNLATGSQQVGTQLRVDFSLTDGGAFDADGLANGIIEVAGGRGQLALSLVGQNPAPPPGSDFIV